MMRTIAGQPLRRNVQIDNKVKISTEDSGRYFFIVWIILGLVEFVCFVVQYL